MELKEAVLSTIAELNDDVDSELNGIMEQMAKMPLTQESSPSAYIATSESKPTEQPLPTLVTSGDLDDGDPSAMSEKERRFLEALKERTLVLFEGMQSPNNRHMEAKVELILNFLEYLLSVIDERLE